MAQKLLTKYELGEIELEQAKESIEKELQQENKAIMRYDGGHRVLLDERPMELCTGKENIRETTKPGRITLKGLSCRAFYYLQKRNPN